MEVEMEIEEVPQQIEDRYNAIRAIEAGNIFSSTNSLNIQAVENNRNLMEQVLSPVPQLSPHVTIPPTVRTFPLLAHRRSCMPELGVAYGEIETPMIREPTVVSGARVEHKYRELLKAARAQVQHVTASMQDHLPSSVNLSFPSANIPSPNPNPYGVYPQTTYGYGNLTSYLYNNVDNNFPYVDTNGNSYGVYPLTVHGDMYGRNLSHEDVNGKGYNGIDKRHGADEEAGASLIKEVTIAGTGKLSMKTEASTSAAERCRVCLGTDMVTKNLLGENNGISLSAMAMSIANVRILPGDGLPALVCSTCAEKLECAYRFKLEVERADGVLRGEDGATEDEAAKTRRDSEVARDIGKMQRDDQKESASVAERRDSGTHLPLNGAQLTPPRPLRTPSSPEHKHCGRRRRRHAKPTCRTAPPQPNSTSPILNSPKEIPSLMEIHVPNPSGFNSESASTSTSISNSTSSISLSSRCYAAKFKSLQTIPRDPSPRFHTPKHSSSPTVVVGRQLRGDGACWRCGRQGHTHRECRAPKRWAYCYLCGERHVRINTCPQCSASWWKAHQEQRSGYSPDFPQRYGQKRYFGPQERRRYPGQYERRQNSGQNGHRQYTEPYGRCHESLDCGRNGRE